jgi:hypothetical protein
MMWLSDAFGSRTGQTASTIPPEAHDWFSKAATRQESEPNTQAN